MPANRFYIFTLAGLSLLLGVLSYGILKPFLTPLAWAIVFSVTFYPIYAFLRRYIKWRPVASILTLLVILIVILGPFSYLSFLLVSELKDVAGYIDRGELASLKDILNEPRIRWVLEKVSSLAHIEEGDISDIIVSGISDIGRSLIGKVTKGVKDVVSATLNFIIMSFSIFFLLRDGPDFIKRARNYMPFSEEQKDRLERLIRDMVVSTIFGGVVVALVQGLMGGIAFYFLGIPSPVIWGSAIGIMSFIPVLGTFSIWGPAVVYLFLQGFTAKGVALLIIGTFGISLVDNILKPVIIGGRTKMPTLVIFFSVLGGIKLFGLIGLIMGPLILALFISVFEIFRNIEGGANV